MASGSGQVCTEVIVTRGYERGINCICYNLVNAQEVAGPAVCPTYVYGNKVEEDIVLDLRELLFYPKTRIIK